MIKPWTKADYVGRILNPNFPYNWKTEGQTVLDYFDYKKYFTERKKNILCKREDVISRFGNPTELKFADKNIITFDLKPYSSINLSGGSSFGVHRLIYPAYRRVFEMWAAWGEYPLCAIGSSYSPRYAITDDKIPIYKGRYEKSRSSIDIWVLANVERIKKTPGLESVDLNELAVKLFFYESAIGVADTGRLSNHSFGLALDVNPRTNALSSKNWDMPKKLVEIFMEEGFYWGGYYGLKQLDAMHFEYKLDETPRALPVVFAPFSGKNGEPPVQTFSAVENGDGGLYPIGKNCNLHGGIHLRPSAETGATVRSTLPGYIVAARLLSPDMFPKDKMPLAFCSGNLGLVLVRHSGYKLKNLIPDGDPVSWYSLYLHLAPPQYDLSKKDDWNSVPWFRKLLLAKYGSAVIVDPDSENFLKNIYLESEITESSSDVKGYLAENENVKTMQSAITFRIKNDEKTRLLVPKKAVADLKEALDCLQKGALITFHKPFLEVRQFDPVGIVNSDKVLSDVSGIAADHIAGSSIAPGFLHWEWLSPPGDFGLEALPKLLELTDADMKVIKENSASENNFFEASELETILKPLLPEKDQESFTTAMSKSDYGDALSEFLQKKASFATETKNDLINFKNSSKSKQTYPITINIKNINGLPPPDAGENYAIDFEFVIKADPNDKITGSGTYNVNDVNFPSPLVIQVPVETTHIRIKSKTFHIEEIPVDDKALRKNGIDFFKDIVSHRWRGCLVSHLNEWTVDELTKLLATLKEKKLVADAITIENLKPLAWYNRVNDKSDPFSEEPILGAEGEEVSLFSAGSDPYLLPANTSLVNVNPVSGNWLVTLAEQFKLFAVEKSFDFWKPSQDCELSWWSIIKSGSKGVYLVAIANGSPDSGTVKMKLEHGSRALEYEVPYSAGIAHQLVDLSLWGDWTLTAENAPSEPTADGYIQKLSSAQPVVSGPVRWSRDKKSGCVTLRAFFNKGCPDSLKTFIHLRLRDPLGGTVSSGYAVLVRGTRQNLPLYTPDSSEILVNIKDSKKISPYFSVAEFNAAAKAAKCTLCINIHFLWVLDSLSELWKANHTVQTSLNLSWIAADGLSGKLKFSSEKIADDFLNEAGKIFTSGATFEKTGKEVMIKAVSIEKDAGEWTCLFNPADGFGDVLQKIVTTDQSVKIEYELFIPNGTDFTEYEVSGDDWNVRSVSFNQTKNEGIYQNEIIKVASPVCQLLKKARFADVHYFLKSTKIKGVESLLLEVIQLIEGSDVDWKRAKPKLTWEYNGETKELNVVPVNGKVSITVPFDESMVNKQPFIIASITKNPSAFDGIEIKMPGQTKKDFLIPSLNCNTLIQDKTQISITVWGDMIPPDYYCQLIVEKAGCTPEENELLTKQVRYIAKGKGLFGKINGGKFEMCLLKKGLKKGDVLTFTPRSVDLDGGEQPDAFGINIKVETNTTILE